MTSTPRQCVVLVGGKGTRLGDLTATTQKPLLECGDRPFLAWILRELTRFGIEEFVLLTGHFSDQVAAFVAGADQYLPKPVIVKLSREPTPAGTGGALWHARSLLDERFLVINGDSLCDTNLARFMAGAGSPSQSLCHVLLTHVKDTSRYGTVELNGQNIVAFHEKRPAKTPGTINGGIYLLRKAALDFVQPVCSLETDVLPQLASKGLLTGQTMDGYFVDIGIPDDYASAGVELPKRLHRPAIILKPDGVLIQNRGLADSANGFCWLEGAKDAVRTITDFGFHAFIVTDRAAASFDHPTEDDVTALHRRMIGELRNAGGTIDDLRFYSIHSGAEALAGLEAPNRREAAAAAIIDLTLKWEVEGARSFFIDATATELNVAAGAVVPGYHFSGGNLNAFVSRHLTYR